MRKQLGTLMTVGWIFEGDRDRFFAATELPFQTSPAVPAYRCPFCKETFGNSRLLSGHLEAAHVVKRPFLLMAGAEPSREDVIRAKSIVPSLEVFNCTKLLVGIDGELLRETQRSELVQTLSN